MEKILFVGQMDSNLSSALCLEYTSTYFSAPQPLHIFIRFNSIWPHINNLLE